MIALIIGLLLLVWLAWLVATWPLVDKLLDDLERALDNPE